MRLMNKLQNDIFLDPVIKAVDSLAQDMKKVAN